MSLNAGLMTPPPAARAPVRFWPRAAKTQTSRAPRTERDEQASPAKTAFSGAYGARKFKLTALLCKSVT